MDSRFRSAQDSAQENEQTANDAAGDLEQESLQEIDQNVKGNISNADQGGEGQNSDQENVQTANNVIQSVDQESEQEINQKLKGDFTALQDDAIGQEGDQDNFQTVTGTEDEVEQESYQGAYQSSKGDITTGNRGEEDSGAIGQSINQVSQQRTTSVMGDVEQESDQNIHQESTGDITGEFRATGQGAVATNNQFAINNVGDVEQESDQYTEQKSVGDITEGNTAIGQDLLATSNQVGNGNTGELEQEVYQDTDQISIGDIEVGENGALGQGILMVGAQTVVNNEGDVEQESDQDAYQKSVGNITGDENSIGQDSEHRNTQIILHTADDVEQESNQNSDQKSEGLITVDNNAIGQSAILTSSQTITNAGDDIDQQIDQDVKQDLDGFSGGTGSTAQSAVLTASESTTGVNGTSTQKIDQEIDQSSTGVGQSEEPEGSEQIASESVDQDVEGLQSVEQMMRQDIDQQYAGFTSSGNSIDIMPDVDDLDPYLTSTQTSMQEATSLGMDQTVEQIGLQSSNQEYDGDMQSNQQATQMGFGGTVDQTIIDLAKQVAENPDNYLSASEVQGETIEESNEVTTQDVQQVIVKIVSNADEQGVEDIAELVGQLAEGAQTSEEVAISLQNLASLQKAGETVDVDYAVEHIGTQIAMGKNINQVLVQVSTEVINNYFTDEINKDLSGEAKYDDSDIERIIKDIANSAQGQEGLDVDKIIQQLTDEVANNPEGDLAYSIYNLAALKASGNSYEVSYAVSQVGTQVQVGENINQALIQVSAKVVNNYFADLDNDGTIADKEKEIQSIIIKIATSAATASDEAQLESNGISVDTIKQYISDALANDPEGQLASALENLLVLTEAGNPEGVNFAIKQIGTQIAVGENIDQTLVQISNQVLSSYLSDLVNAYYAARGDDSTNSNSDSSNTDSLLQQVSGTSTKVKNIAKADAINIPLGYYDTEGNYHYVSTYESKSDKNHDEKNNNDSNKNKNKDADDNNKRSSAQGIVTINQDIKKVGEVDCTSQINTIPIDDNISPKGLRVLANYSSCNLQGLSVTFVGNSTLSAGNNTYQNLENMKLVLLDIDTITGKHKTAIVDLSKVQPLSRGTFTLGLNTAMSGEDPATGKLVTLDKVNGLALFNDATDKSIDLEGSTLTIHSTFA
jgi:hypothetical protein